MAIALQRAPHQFTYGDANPASDAAKPKERGILETWLPTLLGVAGGVGGSLIAPGAGTAAGGAGGAALGEWIAQQMSGEKTDVGRIVGEGALGTIGGIGRGVKAVGAATKVLKGGGGVKAAASTLRTGARPTLTPAATSYPATTAPAPTRLDELLSPTAKSAEPNLNIPAYQRKGLSTSVEQSAGTAPRAVGPVSPMQTPAQYAQSNKDALRLLGEEKRTQGGYWAQRRKFGPERPRDAAIYRDGAAVAPQPSTPMPAAPAAAESGLTNTSARQKLANWLTRRGSGLTPGKKAGVDNLDEKVSAHQRLGITGTPKAQHDKVLQKLDDLDSEVDKILVNTPNNIVGTDVRRKFAELADNPTMFSGVRVDHPLVKTEINRYLKMFDAQKDGKEVNDILKNVNKVAVTAKTKEANGLVPTPNEQAALAVKMAGDAVLSSVPAIKPYKADMATLFDSYQDVAKQIDKGANLPILGGALKSPAAVARWAQSKAGAALSTEPKAAASAAVTTPGQAAKGYIKTQGAVRGAQAMVSGRTPTPDANGQAAGAAKKAPTNLTTIMSGETPQQGAYTREAMIADVRRDQANMKYYQELYDMYNPKTNSKIEQSQQKASAALTTLDQLERLFKEAGAGQGFGGYLSQAGAAAKLNPNAEAYEKYRRSAAVSIARAFGETGPLSNQDIDMYARMLPELTDSGQGAAKIIEELRARLSMGAGVPDNGTNVQDLFLAQ